MQLFYKGDIIQMRDKSQWEIIESYFVEQDGNYIYEYQNIKSGEKQTQVEFLLNKLCIVIKLADPIERPKCKVYYFSDYVKKVEKISNNG